MRDYEFQGYEIRSGLELDRLSSGHFLVRQIVDDDRGLDIRRGNDFDFSGKAGRATINLFLNEVQSLTRAASHARAKRVSRSAGDKAGPQSQPYW